MAELIAIGGIQPLMKRLLDRGLLHGDCITVTGKTLAENLADVEDYPSDQDIVRDFDKPIKADSHLAILYGNVAPEGVMIPIRRLTPKVKRNPSPIDVPNTCKNRMFACVKARPRPIIGVINGARSIEPMTTAGEFCNRPNEAIAEATPNIPIKSGPQVDPWRRL